MNQLDNMKCKKCYQEVEDVCKDCEEYEKDKSKGFKGYLDRGNFILVLSGIPFIPRKIN